MFMIIYDGTPIAYVQGKTEALKTLRNYKKQNPNTPPSKWTIRPC